MSYSATLFILVFLNLFAAGIFIYSLLKIPATRVRRAFFGFLISTTFWINFVFLTKMTGLSESELIVISRIIFSFIAVAIGSFGYFIIIFTEQTGELRKPRFWIFVTFGVFFIIASFSGYVENGIKFNESGPSPVYGILHPFLVSFYFICGIYIFLIAHSVYRNTQSESLKYQLQILFWCGLATFLVAGFFNGILPYIAGNSRYSYFGPIGFFVIYLGIFNILRNENTLFLKKEISRFLQEPPFQIQENVFAFRELLGHLNYFFKNNPDRMKKRLGFLDENLQNTGVYLVRDGKSENNALGDSINSQSKVPIGWMQGLYDSVVNLNKDNRRLAFALIRAESDMNETLVPKRMEMPEKFLQL
ncbi:MAG: hypothetical protein K8R21_02880, partial [Leptospira sp.]|nr:hypothetical protein [Leptospira sp.]